MSEKAQRMATPKLNPPPKPQLRGLSFLALGVVFGDIGTSPLYAFETAMGAAGGVAAAMGVASLIFWALLLVVTWKYCFLILKTDCHGEGGIFALLALLREKFGRNGRLPKVLITAVVFGAALLFGDGAITPAISVLSAFEGLEAVEPGWKTFVLPATVATLAALFFFQKLGTGRLSALFSPVMCLWFLTIAILGAIQVAGSPEVLAAFNPAHGLQVLLHAPGFGLAILGAVVLAVTGAEALYADLGHFGRAPILNAWRCLVFPALILNYLGQAAFAIRNPELAGSENLFFLLAPDGALRMSLVILATLATIIASQALITGIFSLTSQAIDLGYLPRFFVKHTSSSMHGQIYIPSVNLLLGIICVLLVLGFQSSAALANAYGIAVTGAMIMTSIAYVAVQRMVKGRTVLASGLLLGALLLLDLPLFFACLTKVPDGGFLPLLLGVALAIVMLTWRKGRDLVRASMQIGGVGPEELSTRLTAGEFSRTPVTQVYLVQKPEPELAVAEILEQHRRLHVIAENIIICLFNPGWANPRSDMGKIETTSLPGNLWIVTAHYGFMTQPNVPKILASAINADIPSLQPHQDRLFYVVSRDLVVASDKSLMPAWQRKLYSFLSRNMVPGPAQLGIPPERFIVFAWMLRV